jgi:hypothetical protein
MGMERPYWAVLGELRTKGGAATGTRVTVTGSGMSSIASPLMASTTKQTRNRGTQVKFISMRVETTRVSGTAVG